MKLDRNAVKRLLALNDAQLKALITRLAGESGIDLAGISIRPDDIASVRRALEMATDEDISLASQQIEQLRRRPCGRARARAAIHQRFRGKTAGFQRLRKRLVRRCKCGRHARGGIGSRFAFAREQTAALTRTQAQERAKPIEDPQAAQRQLGSLKNQIKALGNVNVSALEEYKTGCLGTSLYMCLYDSFLEGAPQK